MATFTFSQIRPKEGRLLIDLEGTRADLEMACEFANRLLAMLSSRAEGSHIDVEALAIATIIRYGRAFKGGVRSIDKGALLEDLPDEVQAAHENILAWRDKHVAHSVNDFEDAAIQARYCLERVREEGITQITVAQSRVICPGVSELQEILGAATFFIERLTKLIEAESGAGNHQSATPA